MSALVDPGAGLHRMGLRLADLPVDVLRGELVGGIDVVVVRRGGDVSVFEGRCAHRGAMLADGSVIGDDLVCGVHDWDYRIDTGTPS